MKKPRAPKAPEASSPSDENTLPSTRMNDPGERVELGVEVLATETGELVPDRPSNSYRNITRVGFEERYVRPNYSLP